MPNDKFADGVKAWTSCWIIMGGLWQIYQAPVIYKGTRQYENKKAHSLTAASLFIGGAFAVASGFLALDNIYNHNTSQQWPAEFLDFNMFSCVSTGFSFALAGGSRQTKNIGLLSSIFGLYAAISSLYFDQLKDIIGVGVANYLHTSSVQVVLFLHGIIAAAYSAAIYDYKSKAFGCCLPYSAKFVLGNTVNMSLIKKALRGQHNLLPSSDSEGEVVLNQIPCVEECNARILQLGIYFLLTVGIAGLPVKDYLSTNNAILPVINAIQPLAFLLGVMRLYNCIYSQNIPADNRDEQHCNVYGT